MCNKIPYETKQDAIRHHKLLKKDPRASVDKKQRPYPCSDCGQWHLTSAPPNKSRVYRRNYRNNKKQVNLIKQFESIKNNTARWKWITKYQAKWMMLYIGDITYVIFNGKTRVIFD